MEADWPFADYQARGNGSLPAMSEANRPASVPAGWTYVGGYTRLLLVGDRLVSDLKPNEYVDVSPFKPGVAIHDTLTQDSYEAGSKYRVMIPDEVDNLKVGSFVEIDKADITRGNGGKLSTLRDLDAHTGQGPTGKKFRVVDDDLQEAV